MAPTKLQEMMAAAGVKTVAEMLRKANTPGATWYQWMHGTPPNGRKVAEIAKVLGCTPGQALDAIREAAPQG